MFVKAIQIATRCQAIGLHGLQCLLTTCSVLSQAGLWGIRESCNRLLLEPARFWEWDAVCLETVSWAVSTEIGVWRATTGLALMIPFWTWIGLLSAYDLCSRLRKCQSRDLSSSYESKEETRIYILSQFMGWYGMIISIAETQCRLLPSLTALIFDSNFSNF